MTDPAPPEPAALAPEPATPPPTPEPSGPGDVPQSQEDWVADRDKWVHFAREHEKTAKANADAAAELQAIKDQAKTQAEKDADARAAAEQRATKAETDLLRLTVAHSKGIPPEIAGRLVGATEAEMSEDADRLLAVMKPSTPPAATGSADGGPRGASKPGQLTKADLKGMTPDQIVEAKAKGQFDDLLRTNA